MGGKVCLCGRNQDRLEETLRLLTGSGHSVHVGDLTLEDCRLRIVESLPVLEGVVHNAGIVNRQLCRMIKEEDIDDVLETNFKSIVLLQRQLLKKKRLADESSVVMMASRAAFSPSIGNSIYAASKGALISYAKVLGLELAPKRIRVNSVCPGMVFTDLTHRDAERFGVDLEDAQRKYPLGRFGIPEDVAYLVIYLLSDASRWMTGSCIDISGGGMMVLA